MRFNYDEFRRVDKIHRLELTVQLHRMRQILNEPRNYASDKGLAILTLASGVVSALSQ